MKNSVSSAIGVVLALAAVGAWAGNAGIANEGARDGARYALDLTRNGIKVDGTACSVGMAAEDRSRQHYTQAQIEIYAKAFANACMGRKVF